MGTASWLLSFLTSGVLFVEPFDDAQLLERVWYDGSRFTISESKHAAGKGCIEYEWVSGGTTPRSSSGIRRLFEPSDSIYLGFKIKLSRNWRWTGRNYHPHL